MYTVYQRRPETGFNTQPPKGGWPPKNNPSALMYSFNTQPPKGGWIGILLIFEVKLCFNTQPPKGGWGWRIPDMREITSFNTQPPKGGWLEFIHDEYKDSIVSTHSRLKAAGCSHRFPARSSGRFQHTAA